MKDAAAVKVLTIIGLIYLPTTIVAVSSGFVFTLSEPIINNARTFSQHNLCKRMSRGSCMFLAMRGCLLLLLSL
jgi:hypothetical protein